MNERSEFLLAALADKQSTIRAVDVKCGFLFFVIFYPIFRLEAVYGMAATLVSRASCYLVPAIFVGGVWLLSFLVLFRAISSIGNPAKRIDGAPKTNTYFMPGIFDLGVWSAIVNPSCMSSRSVDEMLKSAPLSDDDTQRELMFENMKLAYIRDLKTKRVNFCIGLIAVWLIAGSALWILGINQ
jgi:hypothetical protein